MYMNKIVFLFLILVLALGLPFFFRRTEGYSNYTLEKATGSFPAAQTEVLVQDTYPAIAKNELSDNTSNDIWWHYPIFTLGSYKQITNNIRYPNNPDEGTCMPASMCDTLYNEKFLKSNYTEPLPPAPECGTRIGYFCA